MLLQLMTSRDIIFSQVSVCSALLYLARVTLFHYSDATQRMRAYSSVLTLAWYSALSFYCDCVVYCGLFHYSDAAAADAGS